MVQLSIITVGTLKEGYLKEAVAEYKKRLSQYARVDEICLKEEAIKNEDDASEIGRALDAEGARILAAIPKDAYTAALCVEGKEYDSPGLARLISEAADSKGRIALIIGSSHGLSPAVKSAADARISFSRLTFPHQLMKVILMEAVYRSFTIIARKRYHK